jgi:ribosome-associated protein
MVAGSRAVAKRLDVISFTFMADELPVRPGLAIPLAEIELRTSRSSGPGGQHANVTASRVEAVFDVAASSALSEAQKARVTARLGPRLTAAAQDTRSQARNRDLALERLASRLAHALEVQRPRTATRPTQASKRRRIEDKKRRGEIKRGRRRPED